MKLPLLAALTLTLPFTLTASVPEWRFLSSEIRHLSVGPFWGERAVEVSQATRADAADPMPAILAFNEALAAEGVRLLLVPVPPKALKLSAPAGISPDQAKQINTFYDEFFLLLRNEGIRVLDLREAFGSDPEAAYLRSDSHWSPVGIDLAATEIRNLIALHANDEGRGYQRASREIKIIGDLALESDPAEVVQINPILRSGTTPMEASPSARVLVLGDSHTLVFSAGGDMHAQSAGFPEQLSYLLNEAVDLVGVRGSGATPARVNLFRRAQAHPNYWESKDWVIWVFAAREFTESDGWRILPISR